MESLREMRDLGVDSVSLIAPKVQKNVRSTGFHDDPWITPADGSLRLAAREAHRLGMRVLLFPIVYVEDLAEGEWRGTLAPADWDEWFRVYEKMILHYARIAAEELPYAEKLRRYALLARQILDADTFGEFCERHLGHLDAVADEFFGTELARDAVRQKVAALFPAHEVDEFTELFYGRIQRWRQAEGQG